MQLNEHLCPLAIWQREENAISTSCSSVQAHMTCLMHTKHCSVSKTSEKSFYISYRNLQQTKGQINNFVIRTKILFKLFKSKDQWYAFSHANLIMNSVPLHCFNNIDQYIRDVCLIY
jgi:hypothetical protein